MMSVTTNAVHEIFFLAKKWLYDTLGLSGKKMQSKYIISIIITLTAGSACATVTINATDRTNLASKAYVDVTRQDKTSFIGATYDGLPVTINTSSEDYRDQTIFRPTNVYGGSAPYDASTDADSLVSAGVVADMVQTLEDITVPDDRLVCANLDCSLWTVPTANATLRIAPSGEFSPFTTPANSGGQCVGFNQRCTFSGVNQESDCCSGLYCNGSKSSVCLTCAALGDPCETAIECCGGTCSNGTCVASSGQQCLADGADCTNNPTGCCNYCDDSSNQAHPVCTNCKVAGATCSDNAECCSELVCNNGTCAHKLGAPVCDANGATCTDGALTSSWCSKNCVNSVCRCRPDGESCNVFYGGTYCCGGLCVNGVCAGTSVVHL